MKLFGLAGASSRRTAAFPFTARSANGSFRRYSPAALGRGCVKTQNWIDFRGALTIPRTKQIDYRAFYEVVFIWHCPNLAFSHNLGRFRKLTSRKNDHWQWLGDYQIDDNSLTRFSVPLRLKRLLRAV